jgi:hypothetical protein
MSKEYAEGKKCSKIISEMNWRITEMKDSSIS